jgi:phage antirepressor YoqD-like protein
MFSVLENELVKNTDKLPVKEKTMTTKELAIVLEVDKTTITRAVEKLGAVLHPLLKNSQGGYLFNEEQATLIKQEIQKHHNLATRQIDSVSTQVEENQLIMKAMSILQNRNNQLMAELENIKPKAVVYDNLVERNKLLNFRDMAARLGIPQTEFMKILKSKYIYKNSVGEYRAYAEFQHLFALRTYNKSTDKTGEQLLLSMEGIAYFLNKYKGE